MENKVFTDLSDENVEMLVVKLKRRMKIVYKTEDDHLEDLIRSSYTDIVTKVGSDDLSDARITEMIVERAKYAYDDSIEFFDIHFFGQLLNLTHDYGGVENA